MANNVRTVPGRQELIVAVTELDADAVNVSGVVTLFQIPSGSVITSGHLVGDTDNDSTTATLSIGDSTSATRFLGATDIKLAAEVAINTDGVEEKELLNVLGTFAIAGTPTVGTTRVAIQYYMVNRSGFTHGNLVQTP